MRAGAPPRAPALGGSTMDRLCAMCRAAIFWLGVAVFGILMANILVSIGARYLNLPITNLDWVEETSRFLFIWLCFLGAALAVEQGSHIRIDFFARLLPARLQRSLEVLVALAMLVFAAIVTYEGIVVALRAGDRSPVLLIPMSFAYLALPVSTAPMVLFAARGLHTLLAASAAPARGGA
jgi:TRAP-type C4-dicarboxylate transport system permease small subunit